jgi:hypothetical protein
MLPVQPRAQAQNNPYVNLSATEGAGSFWLTNCCHCAIEPTVGKE